APRRRHPADHRAVQPARQRGVLLPTGLPGVHQPPPRQRPARQIRRNRRHRPWPGHRTRTPTTRLRTLLSHRPSPLPIHRRHRPGTGHRQTRRRQPRRRSPPMEQTRHRLHLHPAHPRPPRQPAAPNRDIRLLSTVANDGIAVATPAAATSSGLASERSVGNAKVWSDNRCGCRQRAPVGRTIGYTVDAVEHFIGLLAGRGADPDLDAGIWLRELDRLAQGIDSLEALIHRLFVEERFAGNTADYYDPRNSLLDRVLHRKLGIPITLSIVCLEVGRRAGVTLEG